MGAPGGRGCRTGNGGRHPARSRSGAPIRVSARARRAPRARRARRASLPRRRELGAGRIPRRRHLLRAERLPHHVAPRRRVAKARPHRLPGVLGAPGPPVAPRARPRSHRRRRVRALRRPSGRARADPRRHVRLLAVPRQLASALRVVVLRPALDAVPASAHLVARHRGAVVPRVATRAHTRAARDRRAPMGGDRHHGRARDRVGGAHGGAVRPRRRSVTRVLRHRHARPGPASRRRARGCPGASAAAFAPATAATRERRRESHRARVRRDPRRRVPGLALDARRRHLDVVVHRWLPRRGTGGRSAHRRRHSALLADPRAGALARAPPRHRMDLVRPVPVALAGLCVPDAGADQSRRHRAARPPACGHLCARAGLVSSGGAAHPAPHHEPAAHDRARVVPWRDSGCRNRRGGTLDGTDRVSGPSISSVLPGGRPPRPRSPVSIRSSCRECSSPATPSR